MKHLGTITRLALALATAALCVHCGYASMAAIIRVLDLTLSR